MKEVNVSKRFTDLVGLVAAIFAFYVVFTAHEAFKPSDKLEFFWQDETTMAYINICAAFLLSTLINAVTRRLPMIGPIAAYLPIYFVFEAFTTEKLTEHPIAYILLSLIHVAGALVYMGQWLSEGDRPLINSRRSSVTAIVLASSWLVIWIFAHFKLSMKLKLMLAPAYWMLTLYGLVCGLFALAWYFKARKIDRDDAEPCLWLSLSSIVSCLIVIFLRVLLSGYGF